ncbi:MAG: RNA polymerase sigma factor [Woeseiaceae bacterium]|nr:RNA polymerase sigma factor [Woeseiaceae bacterium]
MAPVLTLGHRRSAPDRFETLMRPHFDALYASARRFALNEADAEDLVQDVCVKAFQNIDDLERMEHPRAWLLRVLYHQFVDRQRVSSRAPSDLASSIDADAAVTLADDDEKQPERQAERMLRVERVLGAMALLDSEQCALLAMHDVDGFSISELSELTELPENTIKSQLYRTRSKLGRLLKNKQLKSVKLKLVGGSA